MTIVEFLNARLDEDEAVARNLVRTLAESIAFSMYPDQTVMDDPELIEAFEGAAEKAITDFGMTPARVLAEVEAKRKIIAFHDQWPVLVTTEPKIEFSGGDGVEAYTARMSQQIDWQTTQQYRARFGTEPPTAPMILALAQVYSGHPDFEEEWRI